MSYTKSLILSNTQYENMKTNANATKCVLLILNITVNHISINHFTCVAIVYNMLHLIIIPLLRCCGRVRNCDIVSMFKWWTNWFKSFVLTQRNKTWQETFELMLLVSSSSSLLCMTYSPFKCFQCYRLTYTVYPILKLSFYLLL